MKIIIIINSIQVIFPNIIIYFILFYFIDIYFLFFTEFYIENIKSEYEYLDQIVKKASSVSEINAFSGELLTIISNNNDIAHENSSSSSKNNNPGFNFSSSSTSSKSSQSYSKKESKNVIMSPSKRNPYGNLELIIKDDSIEAQIEKELGCIESLSIDQLNSNAPDFMDLPSTPSSSKQNEKQLNVELESNVSSSDRIKDKTTTTTAVDITFENIDELLSEDSLLMKSSGLEKSSTDRNKEPTSWAVSTLLNDSLFEAFRWKKKKYYNLSFIIF